MGMRRLRQNTLVIISWSVDLGGPGRGGRDEGREGGRSDRGREGEGREGYTCTCMKGWRDREK